MNRLIARESSIASRNATAARSVRYLQTGSSNGRVGQDSPLNTPSSSAASSNASASSSTGRTTHFGFKTIPEEEKETLGELVADPSRLLTRSRIRL